MINYRTAHLGDVGGLLALWAVAGENQNRPADAESALRALLLRDPEAVIIAEQGGQLIGSVIAGWDGWRAHLYRLAVDPAMRRRGVARHLLERAETRLIDLGAIRIDAMVLDRNAVGSAWWQAQGYRQQEEWSRWVKPVISDR